MSVSKLTPATARANQDVIEVMEKCLAMAKDGDLRNVVVVGEVAGGMYYENVAFENGATLLGHIARAAFAVDRGMGFRHEHE
tara:strand:- start:545 stop:790 length:246 start_codon:yes stop_codon:yes gene_type:complete